LTQIVKTTDGRIFSQADTFTGVFGLGLTSKFLDFVLRTKMFFWKDFLFQAII